MGEERATLTVIMPVYNSAPYLERALNSTINQTKCPDEIICVDDGSTDDSLKILNDLASKNSIIKVIHTENHGEISAKKTALKVAIGEYISFVDSDDWIESNMFEEMLGYATAFNADVVTSGCVRDYGDTVVYEYEHFDEGVYRNEELNSIKSALIDTNIFFRKNIAVNVVNKIFRKDILYKHQMDAPNGVSIGEDIIVAYPCIMDSQCVYVTGKCYYHYCIRGDSVMGAMDPQKYASIKMMLAYLKTRFEESTIEKAAVKKQYQFYDTFMHLFWKPEEVLYYENGNLRFYGNITENSKVAIYGAGKFGVSLERFIRENTGIDVVAWVDKSSSRERVIKPEKLADIEYDIILIAILLADVVEQVVDQLQNMGIEKKRIRVIDPICG